jgi:hypothetical protein
VRIIQLYVVAIALFTLSGIGFAEGARRDGNWWTVSPRPEPLAYVTGFGDGMEIGNRFSYWGLEKADMRVCEERVAAAFHSNVKKYLGEVTNVQLADGLDDFYKDPKNRRIRVYDAVWLVVNGIAGTPHDELDKMIESYRKHAVD